MPPESFCVYQGTAHGVHGEVCATDVVVLWSSYESKISPRSDRLTTNEVYFAFVAEPEMVLRGKVSAVNGERAEIMDYSLGTGRRSEPLRGESSLTSGLKGNNLLRMDLTPTDGLPQGDCAFRSYTGKFIGLIEGPDSTFDKASL